MGSVLCCLGVDDSEAEEHHRGPVCDLRCLILRSLNVYDLNPRRERRIQPSSDQESTPASPASPEDDSAAGAHCSPDDPTCCASNKASGHLHGRRASSELNCDGIFNHSAPAHIYAISEDEDVCPICLEEYRDENSRTTLQCTHHFHMSCMYEWMERSETCPVCGRVSSFLMLVSFFHQNISFQLLLPYR
ncbi:unnamed protein product [Musa acuminata subsp. malaccensis]|uniref:RING-type E3 ubiquitin transferase n=1 Tax=Musa acuminata subsp. malaccensis TaxID=214687 RepID=A0A804I360_MUSAM|nr:PREDICTED: E3 ubiquitin-protein ligase At3g02290-like isoform X2 [Musa acuminata subsp. malaccensis]CAG1862147.1 unnamed protein product [Musa acuminata subsp. malaccensis]